MGANKSRPGSLVVTDGRPRPGKARSRAGASEAALPTLRARRAAEGSLPHPFPPALVTIFKASPCARGSSLERLLRVHCSTLRRGPSCDGALRDTATAGHPSCDLLVVPQWGLYFQQPVSVLCTQLRSLLPARFRRVGKRFPSGARAPVFRALGLCPRRRHKAVSRPSLPVRAPVRAEPSTSSPLSVPQRGPANRLGLHISFQVLQEAPCPAISRPSPVRTRW